jgi:predicted GNAT family acetyltransferase
MLRTQRLAAGDEARALDFLNRQPLKNVIPIGYIRDHGFDSPSNRGKFYGCFRDDQIVGVSLIGHCVVLDGNQLEGSQEAIVAFAEVARRFHRAEVRQVLGEAAKVEMFSHLLNRPSDGRQTSSTGSQLLLALQQVKGEVQELAGLRLALTCDVEEAAEAHAQLYLELYGESPLTQKTAGFRARVRARVEQEQVWILRDDSGLIFKADIASRTDLAVYLEGVWTRPGLRGRGLGRAALKDLCQRLLRQHQAICLFADAANQRGVSFYQGVGFAPHASFRFIRYRPAND